MSKAPFFAAKDHGSLKMLEFDELLHLSDLTFGRRSLSNKYLPGQEKLDL